MKIRARQGFTLMEVLIVVAIIAALVLLAIPTFSASLETSQESACAANRRSLQTVLAAASLSQGADSLPQVFLQQQEVSVCPSGGTISYLLNSDGSITVSCSIHAPGGGFGDAGVMDKVIQTLDTVIREKEAESSRKFSTIDSGVSQYTGSAAFAGVTAEFLSRLETAGIDLSSMGAVSWRYETAKNLLYWTPVDIQSAALAKGDQVPVIRYNVKSGNYSVWYSTVDTSSTGGHVYNVLTLRHTSGEGYAPSTSSSADGNQTYAGALQHLKSALQDAENTDTLRATVPASLQSTFFS